MIEQLRGVQTKKMWYSYLLKFCSLKIPEGKTQVSGVSVTLALTGKILRKLVICFQHLRAGFWNGFHILPDFRWSVLEEEIYSYLNWYFTKTGLICSYFLFITFISIHCRLHKFIHSSDTVFHAVGMEQQSSGRRQKLVTCLWKSRQPFQRISIWTPQCT